MRRILPALAALALLWSAPAHAQNPDALTSCGPTAYFTAGKSGRLSINTQGQLCIIGASTLASPTANTYVGNVNTQGTKTTYRATAINVAAAASASDILTLTGSASKTIRVTLIEFTGLATAAANQAVYIRKRSTVDTGGTAAAITPIPLDSANAAGSGTVNSYTANPTLGTEVGVVLAGRNVYVSPLASASPFNTHVWAFGDKNGQPIVLRGTSEQIAVNLGGAIASGLSATINIEWTEE